MLPSAALHGTFALPARPCNGLNDALGSAPDCDGDISTKTMDSHNQSQ